MLRDNGLEDANKLKILSYQDTAGLMLGFFDDDTKQKIMQRIDDEQLTDDNEK